ncbi:merozoite surface protein 1 [Plasmodium cynomolgi strain B]|uniref:Merozoite surface protein 1 n=1 Tax=Plasmodium cynomolgi (strain B) TaxID=1120755 RepID=K6UUJ2_PLACD|nr:merozoite surface protein 1 [Plasmodium cynomolgi strain B]GAB65875.1 merozoite surface protein 1 [Plasmodium cynomolgi strain B]
MKVLLFLFSFIFFVTKCQCETEDYKQLLVKLDKLEALVVDGYELFQKKKLEVKDIPVDNNANENNVNSLAYKIRDFVGKFLELQIPGHTNLLHMIRELVMDNNGLKYLVESYEEFNQLMHVINFHYDLLRAKLNDMCAHEYCKIPEHLKISDKELDMLKKIVLGYRKPLDNIKDDIGKMEAFITKNKDTIKKINDLITAENVKRNGHQINNVNSTGGSTDGSQIATANTETSGSSSSTGPGSTGTGPAGTGSTGTASPSTAGTYEEKKNIFQAIYNIIFYTSQLEEAQKLIEVLEKRVKVLKEHKSIKALLDQVATEKGNLPSTNPPTASLTDAQKEAQKKIADLEKQIVAIAKTVNFDMSGLFTNAEELEYYLREKAKMAGTLITPESTKSAITTEKTVPTMKETYPHGITYALPESTIFELIQKNASEETFGDLQNPDDGKQPKKGIIISEHKRKELLDKIINKIKLEEDKLPDLKKEYDEKIKAYEKKVEDFQPTLHHFYEGRLENTLDGDKFDQFKAKREEYMKEKKELEKCTYEQNANLINKLKKQLTYLEDYNLRKDVANDEINYFSTMEWKLKNEIYELSKEIRKNESKLTVEKKFDFSGVVELQVQKVLINKKIEALKNVQNLLKNAKVKDDLYIPKVYKTGEKPEPYYLIVLKKEIDKLKDFIPKIETMITTEKAKSGTEAVQIKGQSLRGASETGVTPTPPAPAPALSPAVGATTQTAQGAATPGAAAATTTTTGGGETQAAGVAAGVEAPEGAESQPAGAAPQPAGAAPQPAGSAPQPAGASPPVAPEEPVGPVTPVTTPQPTSQPAAPTAPAAPTMSKLEYLEKLLDFLKSSYACHKHIFVTNSTMNKELLKKYELTDDEKNKIKQSTCDELDLLFNVQNNLPAMYSIYDTMINDLQNLYIELYQKEMLYNIYKNKDTDAKIKAFLETLTSNAAAAAAAPAAAVVPAASAAPAAVAPAEPAENLNEEVVTDQANATTTVPGTPESAVTNTQTTPPAEGELAVSGSSEEEPEVKIEELKNIYEKHLSQIDNYNDYFKKFLESQKENITKMDDTQWKALGVEIEELKKKIQVSLDHYEKYKLKLDRFMKKKNKISNSKEQIKKLTSLKNKLQRRQNLLNNPTSVLKNYTVFFNKKREAEKKEVENTLKNTEILLKYYKARAKYYIGEPFPLKTLSEESMQKEDNYLNLERFRVLSRMEGRLGNNIDLEKENISYLSSGLHHVFTELKEIINNKRYSGNDHAKNTAAVKVALQAYQELLPKVTTQEGASVPAGGAAPVVAAPAPVVAGPPAGGAGGAGAGPVEGPAAPGTVAPAGAPGVAAGGAGAEPAPGAVVPGAGAPEASVTTPGETGETGVVAAQDYAEDYDKVIALPLFGNNDDDGDDKEADQVTMGEAESEAPEIIVPQGINEYDVVYIKPLAGMYKTIKKQLENHVNALNTNIIDMLDSRLKKRNYFLDVLNSDLNPYKYSSSGEYIIKDPYKLLDLEKKKKLLGSYKYIGASVDKDMVTANDGLAYYQKMGDLYKKHLDEVNEQIKEVEANINKQDAEIKKIESDTSKTAQKNQLNAKKEELQKYLPFLSSIQKEYNTLVNKVHSYTDTLKKIINNCQIEKKETETIVNKLEDYSKMDEELDVYKKSKKEDDVKSSGLLEKLMNSKLINQEESKKALSELLNVQTQMLNMSSEHRCIDTNVPENAACYRYLDGTEEWRCLLYFKEDAGKCVPAPNMTCKDKNGGCAPEAECKMNDKNEIVCKCTKEGSEPLFQGVFCSSSSFLSLSFLLLILLFLLSMEL